MTKFIRVTRSDAEGSYIQPLKDVVGIVEAELLEVAGDLDAGTSVTLTLVEMTDEEYAELSEFAGW